MVQARWLTKLPRDAEAESAKAKNTFWKEKLNSHEIVISHTCRYEGDEEATAIIRLLHLWNFRFPTMSQLVTIARWRNYRASITRRFR